MFNGVVMDKNKKHHHSDEPRHGRSHEEENANREEFVSDTAAGDGAGSEGQAFGERPEEKDSGADTDSEVKKLTEELETLRDLMQRRQADFENYKKRQLKLQHDQKRLAIKDMALDILNINDDLLRAIEASQQVCREGSSEDTHGSFREGVNMISRRIEEALVKYGIVEIDAINLPFDPNFHEAVEIEMSPDVETDTVTKVYQKGFKIDDFVLRNARVKVARAVKSADRGNGTAGNGSDEPEEPVSEKAGDNGI